MKPGIHHYFELLSLLIAVFSISKLKNSFLWVFVPYLFITLGTELTANYCFNVLRYSTAWMYNILNIISQVFYAYIFYRFSFEKEHKQTLILLTSVYILVALVYYACTAFAFNNYILVIGGVIQIVFACLHFYGYLQNDNFVSERHYSAGLWIASGVLIFYAGVTICLSLYNYIWLNNLTIFNLPLYNVIPRYLSIILYSCISIALIIWKKPATISS